MAAGLAWPGAPRVARPGGSGTRRGDPPLSCPTARAHLVGVGGEEDVELGPRRSALHVAEPRGAAARTDRTGPDRAAPPPPVLERGNGEGAGRKHGIAAGAGARGGADWLRRSAAEGGSVTSLGGGPGPGR